MRVVRQPDGTVIFDPTGRLAGRGAYLCADGSCWRLALRKSAIQRALEVQLPADVRSRLEQADPAALTGGTHGA